MQELKERSPRKEARNRDHVGMTLTRCFPLADSTCLPTQPQAHLIRGGNTYSELGPPISISGQENAPQTCSRASLVEATPQL